MPTPEQLEAFFERQRHLLAQERQADIDQSSLLLSNCSAKLLEKKGLALLGLSPRNVNIGLGGKTLIELERPAAHHSSPLFPPHSFRPGDLARIDDASSSSQAPRQNTRSKSSSSKDKATQTGIEGVVHKVSNVRIIIAVDNSKSTNASELDVPDHCWLLKIANTVTYDRMDQAVEKMSKCLLGSSDPSGASASPTALQRVLFGLSAPSPPEDIGEVQYFNTTSLNPSQKKSVKLALSSPELALIHGPPGTGKTHTLVEIILQLVSRSKRLLVCGASNLAVDNLLERLVPHKIPLIRLGHPARVLNDLYSATLDAQAEKSDEAQLANDVKKEIETLMTSLTGGAKGKRVKGAERKKLWEEVKVLRKEYRKREGVIVSRVVNDAKVVLATCHGAGSRQLFNRSFDVVIIDEAAQALEPVCWIPILKASKLILAGDPLQLPPTVLSMKDDPAKSTTKAKSSVLDKSSAVQKKGKKTLANIKEPLRKDLESDLSDSESSTDGIYGSQTKPRRRNMDLGVLKPSPSLEFTLFDRMERMWGDNIKQMLDVQYRMNEKICSFPSSTLYSSKLASDPSVATHLLSDKGPSNEAAQDTLSHPVVFFDTSGCEYFERIDSDGSDTKSKNLNDEGSKCNVNEVEVVKKWVMELTDYGIPANEIAIITPYQAQLALLSEALSPALPGLEIGTVDGMQGREKDAVIISLVRSNDKREVGFLKEKRRLNVAMTRPRKQLCVVGDSSTIRHGSPYLKSWMEWLEENADVRFAGDL
ncbi:P-loop containing nucleoside triphosphate hydrolase protein [Serendipita vermifera]|nr:P-loop containing nucleoside triphosphate hydrolase protein [Serendipita vermifera]